MSNINKDINRNTTTNINNTNNNNISNNSNNSNGNNSTLENDPFKDFVIRDWNEFFNFDRFGKPAQSTRQQRINYNLHYYRANYVALLLFVGYFNIVFYPELYLASFICFIVWVFNFKSRPLKGLKPFGNKIVFVLLTIYPLYRVYNKYSILSLVFTFLFIGFHAAHRKRTMKNKATNMYRNIITNLFFQNQQTNK